MCRLLLTVVYKLVDCCTQYRYLPPHVRQQQQLDAPPAANSAAPPDKASPAPPESRHAVTAISVDSANETAEIRKEKRRHRQGHTAYTAPPLLTKRSTSPAVVSLMPCVCKSGLCTCIFMALAMLQCYRQHITLSGMRFSLTLQTGSGNLLMDRHTYTFVDMHFGLSLLPSSHPQNSTLSPLHVSALRQCVNEFSDAGRRMTHQQRLSVVRSLHSSHLAVSMYLATPHWVILLLAVSNSTYRCPLITHRAFPRPLPPLRLQWYSHHFPRVRLPTLEL